MRMERPGLRVMAAEFLLLLSKDNIFSAVSSLNADSVSNIMVSILRAFSFYFSARRLRVRGLSNLSKVTALTDLELRFELRCPQHQNDDDYAV